MFSRLRSLSLLVVCLTAVAACSEAPGRGGWSSSSGGSDSGASLDTSSEGSGGDAGSVGSGVAEDTTDADASDSDAAGSGDTNDTGCMPACEAGQTRCSGSEVVERCVADAGGCAVWLAGTACAGGARCEAVACVEACTDECATGGLGECDGAGVRLCGNFDGDGCLEFSPTEPCPTGTSCSTGFCSATCTDECLASGNLDCSGDRVVVCGQSDADSCMDLSTQTLCAAGESCIAGACIPNNVAPNAAAGADLTGEANSDIPLDGSTSYDPDGGVLLYACSFVSASLVGTFGIVPTDGPRPVFRTTEPGNYRIGLTVTDTGGLSASDTVDLVVTRAVVNLPPVSVAGADQTVTLNTALRLDGSASSGPESTTLTFRWSIVSQPAGAGLSVSCATSGCSVTLASAGAYLFRLSVTDGGGLTATDDVTITVSTAPCLIFSEYVDGVSNNKAFELYNCRTGTFDLADFTVCLFTNGDDRLLLYRDTDGTGSFSALDEVLDAFGETAVRPADVPSEPLGTLKSAWQDVTYRRCNGAAYTGVGSFAVASYFAAAALDDHSGFGTPPTYAGCF